MLQWTLRVDASIGVLREPRLPTPCCCTFRLLPAAVEWCCDSTCPFYSKVVTVTKIRQFEYERRDFPQESVRI